mmetsp:Transcript_14922/g.21705  ORF Transcript_14922/g.21705 Transcript_14922/m.21705 type:complete len:111 (+) Transcript_14922:16-348(+)
MVKKAKKKGGETLNSKLALVIKSGRVQLGQKSTLKSVRQGKAKMIFISNNCPPIRKSEIEYYSMLGKVEVVHYGGNNMELGRACRKMHPVSTLAITDVGDSDILTATASS